MQRHRAPTLLTVWAHPDDEAFLAAGLMARARDRGDRVVVVTATLGEHGTDDPVAWPPARLGGLRQREALASLAVLGVAEHLVLGVGDGACDELDESAALARIIRSVRPTTIVTFGPDGMTGHPDHRAVSRWVSAAWDATGRRADLWHATLTPTFHERWGELNESVGLWAYGRPPCTDEADLVHVVRLEGRALDRKVAALRAHASQTAGLEQLAGSPTFREWWSEEAFVRAQPAGLAEPSMAGGGALATRP